MEDQKNNPDSKTEFVPPPWLNLETIQTALREGGDAEAEVTSVAVCSASAPGDNYAGALYRVAAELSDAEGRSLVVKAPPPGVFLAAGIAAAGLFKKEAAMLGRIVPEMESLFEAASPDVHHPLSPRCHLYGTDPVEFLVLEDLAPQGFKMADRHRGLGLRHSLLALRALARFHAASVALLQKDPSLRERFVNPWRLKSGFMTRFTEASLQATADACRTWPGYEEYAPLLEAFKSIAGETFRKLNEPPANGLTVIAHGDFWTNNIMFSYCNGGPEQMRMLDFQITHIASPAVDLLYFLSTSPSDDVSEHWEELLLTEYHSALRAAMTQLSLEPPPLEALLADVEHHGAYVLFGGTGILPMVKTAEKAADFGAALAGSVEAVAVMFKEPAVKRWVQRVLPVYRRRGWLPEQSKFDLQDLDRSLASDGSTAPKL